jgi:beta-phosphoglucomutase-like phosphatase (HAD superfamily)
MPEQAVGVLFDFDGTLADTESPAMDVAFWELAPFIPSLEAVSEDRAALDQARDKFVVNNAGKAFEFMCEGVDKERAAAGLKPAAEVYEAARASGANVSSPLALAVDRRRSELGLVPLSKLFSPDGGSAEPTLLAQQKSDTNARLAIAARATPHTVDVLKELTAASVPFVISTTSGKPRVPICVDAAGLREYFPDDELNIHSGESDFEPPRFKPAPDVYLRAASYLKLPPEQCVAVEDSASGVGSAANAKVGLIIGYVGASHIHDKEGHAAMLMMGTRSDDGRGAFMVIEKMSDLTALVLGFREDGEKGVRAAKSLITGRFWMPK